MLAYSDPSGFTTEAKKALLSLAPNYHGLGEYDQEPVAIALIAREISLFSRPKWYFGMPGDELTIKEVAALVAAMKSMYTDTCGSQVID